MDTSPAQLAFAYVDSVEIVINANLYPAAVALDSLPPLALDPAGRPSAGPRRRPTSRSGTGAETIPTCSTSTVPIRRRRPGRRPGGRASARPIRTTSSWPARSTATAPVAWRSTTAARRRRSGSSAAPVPACPPVHLLPGLERDAVELGHGPSRPFDDEISRVELNVTTEARRPNREGEYTRTTLVNEVNSIRNVPNAASTRTRSRAGCSTTSTGSAHEGAASGNSRTRWSRMGTVAAAPSNPWATTG